MFIVFFFFFFFVQAEDGIRDYKVTGVQTCALPIWPFLSGLLVLARCSSPKIPSAPSISSTGSTTDKLPGARFLIRSSVLQERIRSEERRVGKECRYRWWTEYCKKKKQKDNSEKDN